jgi:RNA polymerase sigma factor (sigma-70 family)
MASDKFCRIPAGGGDILLKMTSDLDLLGQYARGNSQDAFAALVKRHVNLVYSAAHRQVRSPQLAEEIAQSVFAGLARDAGKLKPDTILTAWLYAVARRTAIDVVRKESRRQLREQIAVEMNNMNASANEWTQIEPLLDDAMAALDETDRSAILLRYFENKNLREVGESLKISDDAAQKRVSRAVEKLREFFSKQKITVGASGLAIVISTNAVQAAPVGLALTITNASLAAGTTLTFMKIATATKLKLAFSAIVVAGAVTAFIIQPQNQNKLRGENELLRQQIVQLQIDNSNLSNRIAEIGEAKKLPESQFTELLKLRGEIGVLRRQLDESAQENHKLQDVKVQMRSVNTNSPVPQIHIKARFIAMPRGANYDFKMFSAQASNKGISSGIFNDESFRNIFQELRSHDDVETLAEPEMVTTSGRQTQMRVTQTINVVTKFALQESNNVSSIVPQTEPVEMGPILDVIPNILSDGYTIELQVIPSVTEFLGYSPSTKTTSAYAANGQEIDVPTASPQFQVQEATNTVNLLDNQTVVLALNGQRVPANATAADATFLQSDGSKTKYQDRKTLVFITATMVDQAGNRVHSDAVRYTNTSPSTGGQ